MPAFLVFVELIISHYQLMCLSIECFCSTFTIRARRKVYNYDHDYVSVPPENLTILNVKGQAVVTSMLNPILEDQTLELVCIAVGGKLEMLTYS